MDPACGIPQSEPPWRRNQVSYILTDSCETHRTRTVSQVSYLQALAKLCVKHRLSQLPVTYLLCKEIGHEKVSEKNCCCPDFCHDHEQSAGRLFRERAHPQRRGCGSDADTVGHTDADCHAHTDANADADSGADSGGL